MNVGQLIDAAKVKTGTLGKLAEQLNKHQNRLTEWKKGERKPSPADVAAMAQIAGLPVLITLAMVEADLEPETRPLWEKALGEVNARLSPGIGLEPVKIRRF